MSFVTPIIHFAQICRAMGIPVSPAEVLDAVGQMEWIDLSEEKQFKTVLKANFIKNHYDQDTFEGLYDFFFHRLPGMRRDKRAPAAREDLLNLIDAPVDGSSGREDFQTLMDLLARDPLGYLDLLLKMQDAELDISEVDMSRFSASGEGTFSLASRNRIQARLRELLSKNFPSGDESLRFYLQEYLLEALPEGVQKGNGDDSHPDLPAYFQPGAVRPGPANLGEVPFQHLTAEEARAVHDTISRLAGKYKDRIIRRYSRSKKGAVDIQRTIRKSAQYEGVPMKLVWRRRLPQKPKIVALCDVSYSVWAAVPFMLNILYSLQDCFRQVKSFVFIARVAAVSDIFARHETMAAIDQVMDSYQLQYPRSAVYGDEKDKYPGDQDPEISDYGTALAQFMEKYSDVLDHRTTLIILGDGRCNFLAPRADLLGKIREKCRRVIWLNPEPEALWGDGDSEILAYRPHLKELRPCGNLRELTAFVSDLFPVLLYSNVEK
ncbi:MAG: VWA domain-containing protein [Syntrophales bacterium]|nr:VWA domain-containing protein [Syntrophales bacterium]